MTRRSGDGPGRAFTWGAVVPLAISLAALALVIGHIALTGGVRDADEGTAAHLWQLLMVAQVPAIAFFAITWLPRAPRAATYVLSVDGVVVLANIAIVRYWNL